MNRICIKFYLFINLTREKPEIKEDKFKVKNFINFILNLKEFRL